MFVRHRPLLDALIARGADPQAIEVAADTAERTGRSVRDVLINDLIVNETELTEASADALGIVEVADIDRCEGMPAGSCLRARSLPD